ncbi:MAG: type II CRISPR-associated endonuclease Cas1 [Rhodospirillaceae bacterium]|nr:type II CRISPR-associated endonuclease Cas1 [Rhodospirillaceae bacterium]
MIGRVVEIATDGTHLAVDRGFMTVSRERERVGQVALDDISALVVHGHGATFSANLVARLSERGTPMVICGANHASVSMLWPADGHHEQGMRMQAQADAPKPLGKRLWRDLVRAKVIVQADVLDAVGERAGALRDLAKSVRSGDPENIEAQAARRYWPLMMGENFSRDRGAPGINAMLNYGYMVLRAATARSIIAAGLHPSLSIHHQSRGTALRLADDLMEPFRPHVDIVVRRMDEAGAGDLDRDVKARLAAVTTLDLEGPKGASTLQTCIDRLALSLAQVYLGERDRLIFPGPALPLATAGGGLS